MGTHPLKGASHPFMRTCGGCGGKQIVDPSTSTVRDELIFTQVDGEPFVIEDAEYLVSTGMIEPGPYAECPQDFHILPAYSSENLRDAMLSVASMAG